MFTPWLLDALARAFIAGDPAPDAVVERGTQLLGRQWRWLLPLAVRYREAMAPESRPNPPLDEVVRFFQGDKGLRWAAKRHRNALELAQPIPPPPSMSPVAAAKDWPLPALETVNVLARWLGLTVGELEWFADLAGLGYKDRNPRLRHYRYRVLQKDASRVRLIEAPKKRLKQLQQRILNGILDAVPLHEAVHGFRKGRSIRTFCEPHVGRRVVLKMDLRDFFPCISSARIQSLFRTFGYSESVADLLAGLCSNAAPRDIWDNVAWETRMLYRQPHLPQGAPTSPALANLCAYHLDCRLHGLAETAGAATHATQMHVCHEHKGPKGPVVCNCFIDEGGPLGTGLQEQVSNRLWRLRSKAVVVSAEGKGLGRTRSGDWQEEDCKGTTDDVSKA